VGIGIPIHFELKFLAFAIDPEPTRIDGYSEKFSAPPNYFSADSIVVRSFSCAWNTPGHKTVGPFTVEIDGQKFVSNPLSIIVDARLEPAFRVSFSAESVKVGETFYVTVECLGSHKQPNTQPSDLYHVSSRSSHTSLRNGLVHSKITYRFQALKIGRLNIRTVFPELPEETVFGTYSIKIE
jgi:hypothetical protein